MANALVRASLDCTSGRQDPTARNDQVDASRCAAEMLPEQVIRPAHGRTCALVSSVGVAAGVHRWPVVTVGDSIRVRRDDLARNMSMRAVLDGQVERSVAILVFVVSGAVKSLHPTEEDVAQRLLKAPVTTAGWGREPRQRFVARRVATCEGLAGASNVSVLRERVGLVLERLGQWVVFRRSLLEERDHVLGAGGGSQCELAGPTRGPRVKGARRGVETRRRPSRALPTMCSAGEWEVATVSLDRSDHGNFEEIRIRLSRFGCHHAL